MKPIANQPFIFQNIGGTSPLPTEDDNRKNEDPGECVKLFNTDTVYLQFEREITETPVLPDLVDPILAENIVPDPGMDDPTKWIFNANWQVTGGKAIHTGAGPDGLEINPDIIAGPYMLRFTVSNIGVGATVIPYLGSIAPGNEGATISTNGFHEMQIERTVGSFNAFNFWVSGDATIDDVTLFRIIDGDVGTPVNGWDWDPAIWFYEQEGMRHNGVTGGDLHFDGLTVDKHYRMTLHTNNSENGYVSLLNGTDLLAIVDDKKEYYYFKAVSTEVTLRPSDDYDGTISSAFFQEVDSFDDEDVYQLAYSSEADETSFQMAPYVVYDEDRATMVLDLSVTNGEGAITISEGCGKFRFVRFIDEDNEDNFILDSNCFEKVVPNDDYKLLKATCECRAWGFDFTTFVLQQRLELEFFNPTYPHNIATRTGSNGEKTRLFASRDKAWSVRTAQVDEVVHDFLSTALLCDNLYIDDVEYFCDDKDYKIGWDQNGGDLTAQSVFTLTLKQGIIYNLNNSCTDKGYLLKVLLAWDEYNSYKSIDKFNLGNGQTMTMRIKKLVVNGESQIAATQYKSFSRDTLGVFNPDLVIADGINGNYSSGGGATTFVQNADLWINEFITGEELRFYDGLSVIEFRKGTTFELQISIRYAAGAPWVERTYTHESMFRGSTLTYSYVS